MLRLSGFRVTHSDMPQNKLAQGPESRSIGWQRERHEEDVMMFFSADEIMAELGPECNEFGVWGKEDLALLENIYRELGPFAADQHLRVPSSCAPRLRLTMGRAFGFVGP